MQEQSVRSKNTAPQAAGRVLYTDLLRGCCVFFVVLLHVATKNMWAVTPADKNFWIFAGYAFLTRCAVPIYFMLSGAFLLDPAKPLSLGDIWKKYVLRLVRTFLVWSAVYAVVNIFTAWDFSWDTAPGRLWTHFYQGSYHFWFLFTLLGLYILLPVLRMVSARASKQELLYLIVLCFVFSSLKIALKTLGILGPVVYILDSIQIHNTISYVGLYFLGYYLRMVDLSPKIRRALYAAGLLCFFLMVGLAVWTEKSSGARNEVWETNYALPVVVQATALFVFAKSKEGKLQTLSAKTQRVISVLAGCSFGVYLCHDLFITLFYLLGFHTLTANPIWSIPVLSALIFGLSCGTVYLLKKFPLCRAVV